MHLNYIASILSVIVMVASYSAPIVSANPTAISWSYETVDDYGTTGMAPSMRIDKNDKIHISYYNNTKNLQYAYKAKGSTTWTVLSPSSGVEGYYSSIDTTSGGSVYISYMDDTDKDLMVAYKSSGGVKWLNKMIDGAGSQEVGLYNALKVGPTNTVHIVYYNLTGTSLKYASKLSGSTEYTNQTVDTMCGVYCSLFVDDSDNVHVAYSSYFGLKYAYKGTGGWKTFTADGSCTDSRWTSIGVDKSGQVHVSYYDNTKKALKYAFRDTSGKWTNATIDNSTVDTGMFTSLALDPYNGVHISYLDAEHSHTQYAYKPSGASSPWTFEEVMNEGPASTTAGTAIALNSTNCIYIAFYKMMGGCLYLANGNNPAVPETQLPFLVISMCAAVVIVAVLPLRRRK